MPRFWERRGLESRVREILRPDKELTFNQLVEKLSPTSVSEFARVLDKLTASKVIDQVIRVESPETHSGIREYKSIEDLPEKIFDEFTGRTIDVTPDNVKVFFRPASHV
jgi:hypothetical protein